MSVCQQPACDAPGHAYDEPRGIWCRTHLPVLWAIRNPWATVRCHKCGKPGAYPNLPRARPCCRAHAPASIRTYLKDPAA